jgi:hypothetical protein
MKFIFGIALVIIGYIIGCYLPFEDIVFPKSKIQFSQDFLIKAGTRAEQRHFQGSVLGTPVEVYFEDSNRYPKLELISLQK